MKVTSTEVCTSRCSLFESRCNGERPPQQKGHRVKSHSGISGEMDCIGRKRGLIKRRILALGFISDPQVRSNGLSGGCDVRSGNPNVPEVLIVIRN